MKGEEGEDGHRRRGESVRELAAVGLERGRSILEGKRGDAAAGAIWRGVPIVPVGVGGEPGPAVVRSSARVSVFIEHGRFKA